MNRNGENPPIYTADVMFHPGWDVKVFCLSSPRVTGHVFHSHDYMQIFYVLRGICHHYVGGKCYDLVRGDGFVLPPYLIHKTLLGENSEIFCCEFLPSAADAERRSYPNALEAARIELSFISFFFSDKANIKPRISFPPEDVIHMEYLMRQMLKEYGSSKPFAREMLSLYVQEITITYARKYDTIARENDAGEIVRRYQFAVQDAIAFIDIHYAEPITLEDVCHVAAISKTYFCYLFKLITSKTFVRYLSDVRISHAMELLETTDLSITRICYEVGFKNLSHFARVFLSTVGLSAKAYRLSRQGGKAPGEKPAGRPGKIEKET